MKEASNSELPIAHVVSSMNFKIQKLTNYFELIKLYDANLNEHLKNKGFFDDKIVVIEV